MSLNVWRNADRKTPKCKGRLLGTRGTVQGQRIAFRKSEPTRESKGAGPGLGAPGRRTYLVPRPEAALPRAEGGRARRRRAAPGRGARGGALLTLESLLLLGLASSYRGACLPFKRRPTNPEPVLHHLLSSDNVTCQMRNDEVHKLGKKRFLLRKGCRLQGGHCDRLRSRASGQKPETDPSRGRRTRQEFMLNEVAKYTHLMSYGRSPEY
ncbi:uncharacterized protein LOC119466766 [Cebus imitator]|uniref:uncharacterized protein LOC119466766 n=1 Tax=Cebus imitator TaxID=2715852 RepID=UPI00189A3C1E|nr:uncharacterized protein LOC119466766 [Cebus imitator]